MSIIDGLNVQVQPQNNINKSKQTGLIALFLRRPVMVSMLALSLMLIGLLAYVRIPLQLMPSGYSMPMLYVQVQWPNATPQEAMRQVMEPLEASVSTVPGVKHIRGRCQLGGTGMRIEFDDDQDMDEAYNNLRESLDRLQADLPDGVRQIYIWKFDPDDNPVMVLGVQAPKNSTDPYQRIDASLVKLIDRIPGVGKVEIWGGAPRVALVDIDADRARARGLQALSIAQQLRKSGFVMTTGQALQAGQVLSIRAEQPMQSLEQLRRIPLAKDIYVADIAKVSLARVDNEGSITTIDAQPALMLGIYKNAQANTVDTCKEIRKQVARSLAQDRELQGFSTLSLFDQGQLIDESMHNLLSSMLYGGAIAALILFAFLRRIRPTLITSLAIPSSLLGALAILYFTGHSLNLLSLMGLMLSVGMVVDNAIVVVERVEWERQQGRSAFAAALLGTREVALAISVATATTVAAFMPIILMSGQQALRFFLGEIGLPVSYALLTSLLVALVIVPWLTRLGSSPTRPLSTAPLNAPATAQELPSGVFRRLYMKILTQSLRAPMATVVISLLLFISAFAAKVPSTEGLQAGSDTVTVYFRPPPRINVDERQEILRKAASTVHKHAQELGATHVVTRLRFNRGRDSLEVYLRPPDERPISKAEVAIQLKKLISAPPGVRWRVGWGSMRGNEGSGLQLSLRGPDSQVLKEISEQVLRRLDGLKGVISVDTDVDNDSVRELRAQLDELQSIQHGIGPATLGGSLSLALRGWRVGQMRMNRGNTDILVRISPESRRGRHGLGQLMLPNESSVQQSNSENLQSLGQAGSGLATQNQHSTQLNQLTRFHESPGFGIIYRDQRETVINISLTLKDENLIALRKRIDKRLDDVKLPRGYQIHYGQRMARLAAQQNDELYAAALAITFVFLLMGILFESWLLPLAVITSVPFAYTGALWALAISGQKRDIMAMVGMVILIGVVVNNAIVLVDAIQRARQRGMQRHDAILYAGQERMRPIFMTALTTIGGLLPLALGSAQVAGVSYQPLAITVMGGLIASTAVTLFLVPSSYLLFDNLAAILRGSLMRRLGPNQASDSPDSQS